MAGIGEWIVLSSDELKAAFEKAAAEGKDYLVQIEHTSQGRPFGLRGVPMLLETIDIIQEAHGIARVEQGEQLKAIFDDVGPYGIMAVYDLRKPFEQARGGKDLLDPAATEALDQANERFRAWDAYQQLPWYKKIFVSAPV